MQTVPGDGIFLFPFDKKEKLYFCSAYIPDGMPRGNRQKGDKKQAYILRLLNGIFELLLTEGNFTFVALFKIYKMPEETLCEQ